MDDRPNPLEERPFAHELGDVLRPAVEQARTAPPPLSSLARALERARRLGPGRVNPWQRYHRTALAAAVAAVLLLATGLLLICWRYDPANNPPTASAGGGSASAGHGDEGSENSVAVTVDRAAAGPTGPAHPGGDRLAENPFVDAAREPLSTFPLAVNPAVYHDLRRSLLEERRLPSADAVRVADLVNSFAYSYPEPMGDAPVSLTLDLAECPWNAAHQLARIGLHAGADAVVREARVQVAFNPRRVAAYRLIGYEGRRQPNIDGESLAAGQAVTALYEVAPASPADAAEWLTVKLRCRDRSDKLCAIDQPLTGAARRFTEAPADFRFAAAAAEFGLLLRQSEHRGAATYAGVRVAARDALGADPDGRRTEFLALVDAADQITSERKLTRRDARSS